MNRRRFFRSLGGVAMLPLLAIAPGESGASDGPFMRYLRRNVGRYKGKKVVWTINHDLEPRWGYPLYPIRATEDRDRRRD